MRIVLILSIAFIFSIPLHSQSLMESLKNYEERGDEYLNNWDYARAISFYEKALQKNPNNLRAKLQIAYCYNLMDEWENSLEWFEDVEKISPSDFNNHFAFHYGDVLHHLGKFDKAKEWYQFIDNHFQQPITLKNRVISLEKIEEFYQDSSQYIINMLPFNGIGAEFSPYPYADGLIYTTHELQHDEAFGEELGSMPYDMFYYPMTQQAENILIETQFAEINSHTNDGTLVIYDKNRQMIFTRNNGNMSLRRNDKSMKVSHLGLFHATFDAELDRWTNIEPLVINNKNYSVGHPAITRDGKTLYFVSDMPDGFGGTDIYKSHFENGSWGPPVNLGAAINTDANEFFPTVFQDSVLYFSSEGQPGLGGLDIFKISLREGETNVENLGYPINSPADDFGIVFLECENKGYFTSNRKAFKLRDNIYSFDFDENYQRKSKGSSADAFAFQGMVINKDNRSALPNTKVTIIGMESRDVKVITTDSLGWFKVQMKKDACYAIKSEKDKFYTYKLNLMTDKLIENGHNHVVEMEKIEIGQIFELDKIFYEYADYKLNEEAKTSLMQVVDLLKDNPSISIELRSHTDSRGSDKFNITLSQKRAKHAADFIIHQGINISRIVARGYGESQLIFPCGDSIECEEEQHQQNRRTEMKILDYK